MTPDDILAKVRDARAICDAATDGDWQRDGMRVIAVGARTCPVGEPVLVAKTFYQTMGGHPRPNDATFIQHARTGWPEALDLIEQLVARVQEAEEVAEDALTYGRDAMHRAMSALSPYLLPILPPEPPPGKMRVTASVPVTYDVSPGQIAAYLRAKGWKEQPAMSPHRVRWKRDVHSVLSSLDDDAESVETYVVPSIAEAEGRSTGEVLRDIAAMEAP